MLGGNGRRASWAEKLSFASISGRCCVTSPWLQRDEAFMRGMTLLQTSRELEPGHLETLERLREVYEEVMFDDAEEVAALEQAIDDAREKEEAE